MSLANGPRLVSGYAMKGRWITPARAAALAAMTLAAAAHGQLTAYSGRDDFLAATGAQAGPEWPNVGHLPGGVGARFTLGDLTLSVSAPSSGLWIGSGNHALVGPDWTTLVAGNDIAIDGRENLNVDFAAPVVAMGFDFAEPTRITVRYNPCSGLCPCANSTFRVTLLRGGSVVGTFDYNRPDDVAAFVGIQSSVAFDRAEIREMSGTCDDEYFGRFYAAACGGGAVCPADFNQDGGIDGADVAAFFAAWEGGDCTADVNADGGVDGSDVDTFFAAWEAGGCG